MVRSALVLGCGRSGTSIFGEMFATFEGFHYFSEPQLGDLDQLVAAVGSDPVAVKVPRVDESVELPSGCAVDLGEFATSIGRDVVVFWQVRHPLDAVCSLRVGIADGWGHHPRPLDWRDWLDRPLVEQCAHHWSVINGDGYARVHDLAVVNRFEDMIADPRSAGLRAADAVSLSSAGLGPAFDSWVDRVQDTNNERFVEAETSRRNSRPDHSRRVGRWEENLTTAEVDAVVPIVSAGAARFGYDLP